MPHTPYRGDRYLSFDALEAALASLAAAHRGHARLEVIGHSRGGRPLTLLTLGRADGRQDERPGFWLDGGTHAAEWTGVMAALYAAEVWAERAAQDPAFAAWLGAHTLYVLPCMSPDGYQALLDGAPFLRSSLRPPVDPHTRCGLDPHDLDGDGAVRWMRWRHPAGPLVQDPELPVFLRPRTLDDDPADAWFCCPEGSFLLWDGQRWTRAPTRFGLDLNRNFPAHWAPTAMWGMDGGAYPLSEPESRAAVEALAARPRIAAALTNHTYTGALLTQPYRADSPLGDADIRLMEELARQAVQGTGYRVFRTHPDFTYDPKRPIVGVWSDTLSTVFGIPGYTLELWDPYGRHGVTVLDPARSFLSPDPAHVRAMLAGFAQQPGAVVPWRPFEHPQLGPVELGGLDYMRTVRNPPESELAQECARGLQVAERLRRALPQVEVQAHTTPLGPGLIELVVVLENLGALGTAGLDRGEQIGIAPGVWVSLSPGPGVEPVQGDPTQTLHHLDGWAGNRGFGGAHPLYPNLPARGHRAVARWVLRGAGLATLRWSAGRAGLGERTVELA